MSFLADFMFFFFRINILLFKNFSPFFKVDSICNFYKIPSWELNFYAVKQIDKKSYLLIGFIFLS